MPEPKNLPKKDKPKPPKKEPQTIKSGTVTFTVMIEGN